MSNQANTQNQFFQYLNRYWTQEVVLHKTMEELKLGKGAVYKRMNGTTASPLMKWSNWQKFSRFR